MHPQLSQQKRKRKFNDHSFLSTWLEELSSARFMYKKGSNHAGGAETVSNIYAGRKSKLPGLLYLSAMMGVVKQLLINASWPSRSQRLTKLLVLFVYWSTCTSLTRDRDKGIFDVPPSDESLKVSVVRPIRKALHWWKTGLRKLTVLPLASGKCMSLRADVAGTRWRKWQNFSWNFE